MATVEPKYPRLFPGLLFLLSLVLVGTVLGCSIYSYHLLPDPERNDATVTIAVVRLAQFTIGMLIGVFLLCLGTYLSWVGVREKIGLEVQGSEKVKASLAALGPGMVLAVCGTFIISVCLWKDVHYSEKAGWDGEQPGPYLRRSIEGHPAPDRGRPINLPPDVGPPLKGDGPEAS